MSSDNANASQIAGICTMSRLSRGPSNQSLISRPIVLQKNRGQSALCLTECLNELLTNRFDGCALNISAL